MRIQSEEFSIGGVHKSTKKRFTFLSFFLSF